MLTILDKFIPWPVLVANISQCQGPRVVNGKQVDVAALRSNRTGCPGMR